MSEYCEDCAMYYECDSTSCADVAYQQGILVGINKCIKLYNEMKPSLATNVYEFGEKLKALKEHK